MTTRRIDRLLVLALLTAIAVLNVAESAAQVDSLPAEPFKLPGPTYLPWTKICGQHRGANMCLTGSVGRIRNEAASAVLFEQEGRSDKILRVTLPLIVQIGPGTRLTVDQGDPANRPYVFCLANGCAADFTATDELIGKLKNGRYMFVQAIDVAGQGFSWTVPVSDFNKAYEGLPTDPRKFKSIYESPPKPWKDDTLQPHLRPGNK